MCGSGSNTSRGRGKREGVLGQDNVEVDDRSMIVLDSHYIYLSQGSIVRGKCLVSGFAVGLAPTTTTTSDQE